MRYKVKKYLKEIIFFVFALIIATNLLSYYRSMDLNKDRLDISHFTLIDKSKYIVKENKPLLVYFWATWCPICKFQSPNIQKLSKDYEVVTIAIDSGSEEQIKKYMKENNLTFRVVNDKDGYFTRKFNIKVFPTTLIFDKDKSLSFSEVGYTSEWGLYFRILFSS